MSRLKMSSYRLQVESERWHKPASIPISERKCTICNKLEDEFHFMFECSLYTELRNKYIKSYYWRHPNTLFASEDKVMLQNLAMYIAKCFELRNSMLHPD